MFEGLICLMKYEVYLKSQWAEKEITSTLILRSTKFPFASICAGLSMTFLARVPSTL